MQNKLDNSELKIIQMLKFGNLQKKMNLHSNFRCRFL